MKYFNKILKIENLSIEKIANKFKTPSYCYSYNQLKKNIQNFKKSFKSISPLICFSVKSNANINLIKEIKKFGLGADVVSMGELMIALKAGVNPKKIVFSGVGKTREEIIFALKKNIKQINVESFEELKEIEEISKLLNKRPNISLRLNPDVNPDTHEKISTGRSEDKFGISEKELINIFINNKKFKYLNINGISIHIGSQITKLGPFKDSFKKVREIYLFLKKNNIILSSIDLGGGIGIFYEKNNSKKFKIKDYANIIENYFSDLKVEIILEPGRYLVGSSGLLVSKVLRIKKGINKEFLIIDAGMNNLIRPSLYNTSHKILPSTIIKKKNEYEVVGPICESSDIFAKNLKISTLKKNSLIVICSAGAYGSSMASDYNLRQKANEVMINGNKII